MRLYIRPCDEFNKKDIENLFVLTSQKGFIESNKDSLREADQHHFWRPVGLYDDDTLVGFAMYGMCDNDHTVWLDRFMISSEFQNKKYGKNFLTLLLPTIIKEYNCQKIYLSFTPDNSSISDFYASFGFKITGEKDPKGEIIMCFDILHKSLV